MYTPIIKTNFNRVWGNMVISSLNINFVLPLANSLKGRRVVINSIKDRVKKLNVSVIDLSGEYPKEGSLGMVFASLDDESAHTKIQKIEELLYKIFPEIDFEISYELI